MRAPEVSLANTPGIQRQRAQRLPNQTCANYTGTRLQNRRREKCGNNFVKNTDRLLLPSQRCFSAAGCATTDSGTLEPVWGPFSERQPVPVLQITATISGPGGDISLTTPDGVTCSGTLEPAGGRPAAVLRKQRYRWQGPGVLSRLVDLHRKQQSRNCHCNMF